jgi:hypothetical protein
VKNSWLPIFVEINLMLSSITGANAATESRMANSKFGLESFTQTVSATTFNIPHSIAIPPAENSFSILLSMISFTLIQGRFPLNEERVSKGVGYGEILRLGD